MLKIKHNQGFSTIAVVIAVAIVATIALGGWLVWQNRQDRRANNQTSSNTSTDVEPEESDASDVEPVDLTEGGKYLVIEEWGARVELPADMRGKVSYSLSDADADPDGNIIQAAGILIAEDFLSADNFCTPEEGVSPPAIKTGAQYIKSEASKPFDSSRYRWSFEENILTDGNHNYHLSYVAPSCVGSQENEALIKKLHSALLDLKNN